jgi:hypothetical protein
MKAHENEVALYPNGEYDNPQFSEYLYRASLVRYLLAFHSRCHFPLKNPLPELRADRLRDKAVLFCASSLHPQA